MGDISQIDYVTHKHLRASAHHRPAVQTTLSENSCMYTVYLPLKVVVHI